MSPKFTSDISAYIRCNSAGSFEWSNRDRFNAPLGTPAGEASAAALLLGDTLVALLNQINDAPSDYKRVKIKVAPNPQNPTPTPSTPSRKPFTFEEIERFTPRPNPLFDPESLQRGMERAHKLIAEGLNAPLLYPTPPQTVTQRLDRLERFADDLAPSAWKDSE